MSQIQTLKQKIESRLPGVSAVLDEPINSAGPWMLDVVLGDRSVNVEWRPHRGFGISSRALHRDRYYGEGPDEILSTVDDTVGRVVELIKSRATTAPPTVLTLTELRERLRLSQAQMAQRLRVSQAAVSELEKNLARSQLQTVRKAVEALGGELELRAVLPTERSFTLKLPEPRSTPTRSRRKQRGRRRR
jgi:DNA-binding XRE family transcriptional regulator